MPKAIYQCNTCGGKYEDDFEAFNCHPSITTWYACDDPACDSVFTSRLAAEICDHLEEETNA